MNPTPTPDSPSPTDIARLRELLAKIPKDELYADVSECAKLKDRNGWVAMFNHLNHRTGERRETNEVAFLCYFLAALRNAAPALLDELTGLRFDNETLRADSTGWMAKADILQAERDKLREEVERLRAACATMRNALNLSFPIIAAILGSNPHYGAAQSAACAIRIATSLNAGTELLAERDSLRMENAELKAKLK